MLCCVCKKNRAAKIRERESDGRIVREYYCADCYARLFPDFSSTFAPGARKLSGAADNVFKNAAAGKITANNAAASGAAMNGIAASGAAANAEKKERRCPYCGTTAREYYKSKLLGCAECYRYLFEEIKESVFAMQGDEPHRGKRPAAAEISTAEEKTRGGKIYGEEEQLTIFGAAENFDRFAAKKKGERVK